MHVAPLRNVYADVPSDHWLMLMVLGVVLVLLGIMAISVPLFTALAITTFLGIILTIGGLVMAIGSFHLRVTDGFWATLLNGILSLIVGILLLLNPGVGVLVMTLLISVLFFVGGLVKITTGLTRSLPNSGWFVLGGIVSLILGILIGTHWPSSAIWVIGLYVGIYLIYMGFLTLQTAFMVHHTRHEEVQGTVQQA